ncbi:unnamed protein product, partial [Candidula unifasciata]
MVKLKVLELRENHISSLPRSFSRLVELERLDIGNNELTELSDVIGGLRNLLELWCDNNQIATITRSIGKLKHLMYLDASNNQLQELPREIEGCTSLADLHLSSNDLVELPDSIGNLKNLITLKVDDNQLAFLPRTLGGLSLLSELNMSVNDLEELPASIGLLRNLRTLYADENLLRFLPAEIGSCNGITVLSLRNNKLTYIPDELGRIPRLRVLNLSDNLLQYLPFSIIKLKELQALWLTENQTRPLIPLQSEYEPETGRKILTCYLLPQGELAGKEQTATTPQIHFEFAEGSDEEGTLVRCPTPYPKELKQKVRHARSLALRQLINTDSGSGNNEDAVGDAGDDDHTARLAGATHEKDYGNSQGSDKAEMRMREGRGMRPASPRLQESHRLYRYDKEKLIKDKARMQHRLSVPEFDSGLNGILKNVQNQNRKVKQEEAFLPCRSDSVPNLTSDDSKEVKMAAKDTKTSTVSSPLTFNDIYFKQPVSQHKQRRPRRTRDYHSDTDHLSEIDLNTSEVKRSRMIPARGANSEILSVQSQPLPHLYYHQYKNSGRWKETTGCASDVGGYSGGGGSFPTANAAAAAFQRKYQQFNHSSLQNISPTDFHSRACTPDSSNHAHPNPAISSEMYKFDKRTYNDFQRHDSKINDFRRNTKSQQEYTQRTVRTKYRDIPEHTKTVVTSDELYNQSPKNDYYQCRTKSDPTINIHYSSSQTLSRPSGIYGKTLATPPPYSPAPPYVKSSNAKGEGRCTNRLSSDLAFNHRDSARSASSLAANSVIDNFIVNQQSLSPCGFHGSDPYIDLPTSDREKLGSRDFEDSDHKRQNHFCTSDSYRSHRGTPTHNSDSSSSHIGSASMTGSVYVSGRGPVGRGRSNSFDSQIEVHNNSSPAESPHSVSVYSSQSRSRKQDLHEPYSLSIDPGNYEELLTTTNQEHSSQVSSSSDSGYGHGQHVYEFIGDHLRAKGEKFSSTQEESVPAKLSINSASSSQRQVSVKGSLNVLSKDTTPAKDLSKAGPTTQEHKEQFRVTIKKNPGLGFSIAGGIGSHGNPFNEEDIGIFVTKVIPNGPASKFLRPGDKILQVNKVDFQVIDHNQAVAVLKKNNVVTLLLERVQKVNVV